MKKYKVLFADLDGTLIDTVSGNTFPKGIWDMRFRFDVLDAINKLAPDYIFIVTNQGGIEKGFVKEENFIDKIKYITSAISEYTNKDKLLIGYTYCASNDKYDKQRKPNTGMLSYCLECHAIMNIIPKGETLMIGDASGLEGQFSDSDKKTAENFGIDYLDVEDFIKEVAMNEILKKRIEEGAQYALSHQFISVKEALPEYDKAVIVAFGDDDYALLHRSNNSNVLTDINGFCNYGYKEVLAWMPIPKFETKK